MVVSRARDPARPLRSVYPARRGRAATRDRAPRSMHAVVAVRERARAAEKAVENRVALRPRPRGSRFSRGKPSFSRAAMLIEVKGSATPRSRHGYDTTRTPNHFNVHMAKKSTVKAAKAASKPKKISPAGKPRTKGEFFTSVADQTDLPRKQIAQVFDAMGKVIAADLSRGGPGILNVAGLMKVMVKRMPATKARKGINPFTKQEVVFKAKPARNVIKIRPLKALKSMV
jgi:nucleoid DNA-binding protein